MFRTAIVTAHSGYEQRNQNWLDPLRRYDLSYSLEDRSRIETLLAFFVSRAGRMHSFLVKDWTDYYAGWASTTLAPSAPYEVIGVGDGVEDTFQLTKTYEDAAGSYVRPIKRPKTGTVKVYVDGVEKTEATHWTLDYSTGVLTFTPGNIPPNGDDVAWAGEFRVHCRFDSDEFNPVLDVGPHSGSWSGVTITEVRE